MYFQPFIAAPCLSIYNDHRDPMRCRILVKISTSSHEVEVLKVRIVIGGTPWHYGPLILDSMGLKGTWDANSGSIEQVLMLK